MTSTLTASIQTASYTPLSGGLNIPLTILNAGSPFVPNNTTGLTYSNLTLQPGYLYELTIFNLTFTTTDPTSKVTLTVNTQPKQSILPSQSPFTSTSPIRFIPTDLNGAAIFLQFTGTQTLTITGGNISILAIPLRSIGSELRQLLQLLLSFILGNLNRCQRRKLRSALAEILKCVTPNDLLTITEELSDLVSE